MSRGMLRTEIAKRVENVVADWLLNCSAGDGSPRAPRVLEQFHTIANDGLPDAPGVTIKILKSTQRDDGKGNEEHTASVSIHALVKDIQTEQGYRDAENMAEAIENDLKSNRFLDNGRYELVPPFELDISGNDFTVFEAWLSCSAQMPAVFCLLGPDGAAIDI